MARTKDQINTEMLTALAANAATAALTSTSQTSVWGQFKDAIVSVLQVNDQLADVQEQTLNRIADEAVPGTPAWLYRQAFKFQSGDAINLNSDLTFSYPVPDDTKKIITRCSIQQLDDTREVLIKIAKGVTGSLAPLTAQELSSFKAYMNRIKFAGTHLLPISLAADRIVTRIEIYYAGELQETDVKENVITAINLFYQNIQFDGAMYISKLVDAIQAVPGIKDVQVLSAVARPATVAVNDASLSEIVRFYNPQAGYIVPETATGYTLDDTLTLIPQV